MQAVPLFSGDSAMPGLELRYFKLIALICLLSGMGNAWAASEEQFSSIRQLGKLNGVALHCKALLETQRMKRALVLNLPKRRQLGELFDYESNISFMDFIKQGAGCPRGDELRQQVDAAIVELEKVFK